MRNGFYMIHDFSEHCLTGSGHHFGKNSPIWVLDGFFATISRTMRNNIVFLVIENFKFDNIAEDRNGVAHVPESKNGQMWVPS